MSAPSACVIAFTAMIEADLLPGVPRGDQDQGSARARLVECAGRTCYDSYGKGRGSAEYHRHILEVGHGSVLEHASISFHLVMSRGCSHEWVRHRAGCAISQRSTRYVDESESDWIWHPLLQASFHDHQLLVEEPAKRLKETAADLYRYVVDQLQADLVAAGVDRQMARKQARGAARGLLGNALQTEMIWTANIRALRNVLEQRASPWADAEIRLLANAVYEAALPWCPEYLSDYRKVDCQDGIGYALETDHRKI